MSRLMARQRLFVSVSAFLGTAAAGVLFIKKICDRSSPCAESSERIDGSLSCTVSRAGVEAYRCLIDCRIRTVTNNELSFFRVRVSERQRGI